MESHVIGLFEREIARQCGFALRAADELQRALARFERDVDAELRELAQAEDRYRAMYDQMVRREREDAEANFAAWYAIQGILVFAGNVSKLLWGANANRRAARAELRRALEISDDSPLEDRRLRNHFEHFDERLEAWASEDHPRLSDGNIRHVPQFMLASRAPQSPSEWFWASQARTSLREFDHELWMVTFYREPFELRPIVAALDDLRPRAERQWRERLGPC